MSETEPRADLAQAPAPVRVKALEWSLADWNQREGSEESALSSFGRYYVKSGASYWGPGVIISHGYHSLTAAKAAAQQDYESRILAALEPDAAPTSLQKVQTTPDAGVVAELVEAAKRVADQDAKPEHAGRYAELRQTIDGLRGVLAKMGVR